MRVFREANEDRLVRRLRAVTGGDLTGDQVKRLAKGDLSLIADLSLASKLGVGALVASESEAKGQLEKMVGTTLDYVPVSYLDLARRASRAVVRVVDVNRRAVGTGTMVSPDLFLTNHHVSQTPDQVSQQIVQFDYELGADGAPATPTEFQVDPNRFFWTCPQEELDASLIAVGRPLSGEGELHGFGFYPLSAASDKHAEGDFVSIIQHPEGDYKQIALRENRVIGRGKGGTTLHYGTDTLPGSSGSPVFNDQFELVALHHAGGTVNETTLEDGTQVPDASNEGIRISALVAKLREKLDELPEPYRSLLAQALDSPSQAFPSSGRENLGVRIIDQSPSVAQREVVTLVGEVVDAEVSLPIRISLGPKEVEPGSGVFLSEPATGVIERNQAPDEAYSKRRGYEEKFLEILVPLPTVAHEQQAKAAVPEGKSESASLALKYFHFSLVQNAERRMPFFTAVNIDGGRARRINRKTGVVEATEKWYLDPRLQPTEQLDQRVFDRQQPRIFDRGHMVRRLDPAWGTAGMAQKAGDDTFHFTNCCPQIAEFNQRARLWAGIENFVLDNARAEKARICVFTGPVFRDDDPEYRGILVPQAFWKLLIRTESGQLRCTAFLADQGELLRTALQGEGEESFGDLGKVAVFQSRVEHIETASGLSFGNLREMDTAALEAAEVEINSFEDVAW